MTHKHIAILDFGSQYMHLISRRIRQMGVLAKIYPTDASPEDLADAWGIIISGGPNSVGDGKVPYDPAIFDMDVPILGLCYGHQLMAQHYGGVITPAHNREYGLATLQRIADTSLLDSLADQEQVWMSHWDSVTTVPDGFIVAGKSGDDTIAVMANEEAKRYGLQFHPEVHHTTHGLQLLKNFVFDICEAQENWSMEEYMEELEQKIKLQIGDRKVFLFVSGGVDSSVAFALLEKILGKERVLGLHVDNGFMRKNESVMVKESLADAGFDDLHVIDASDAFLGSVDGLVDPEEKRHRVGKQFLDTQQEVFKKMELNDDEWVLGQGTIYPDTIETGGTDASETIKTHHNRVPEVVKMIEEGKVVEPLAELYKDEVRELGKQLGLPDSLIQRWPFPGPGLSIRCLNSDGSESVDDEEQVNGKLMNIARTAHVQAMVAPVRSVGVQGDQRSYQHPAIIHGVEEIDWTKLGEVSVKMTNELHEVNRVMLHVGGDVDFSKMATRPGYSTKERMDLLREADAIVTEVVTSYKLYNDIWQFPVILLPLTFGAGEAVVLRPIESQEAMTVNFYHLDQAVLDDMVQKLLAVDGIESVFFDITNKPPATIEWE